MLGPNGGIGRRDGFKIRFLTECRFKSGFGYHTYFSNYIYSKPNTYSFHNNKFYYLDKSPVRLLSGVIQPKTSVIALSIAEVIWSKSSFVDIRAGDRHSVLL